MTRLNDILSGVISEFFNKSNSSPIKFFYNEDPMRASLEVSDPRQPTRLSPKLCDFLDIDD